MVAPLLMHWSYHSLTPSHGYVYIYYTCYKPELYNKYFAFFSSHLCPLLNHRLLSWRPSYQNRHMCRYLPQGCYTSPRQGCPFRYPSHPRPCPSSPPPLSRPTRPSLHPPSCQMPPSPRQPRYHRQRRDHVRVPLVWRRETPRQPGPCGGVCLINVTCPSQQVRPMLQCLKNVLQMISASSFFIPIFCMCFIPFPQCYFD